MYTTGKKNDLEIFVKSDVSEIVDLIFKRYPGKRPSEFMGVENELEAFDLDAALSTKGNKKEHEFFAKMIGEATKVICQTINDNSIMLARAMGAKVDVKKPKPKTQDKVKVEELPALEDVLASLGGNGVVLQS